MKIVVIGGSGLIGSKVVARLKERGHDAVAASPRSGVNAVTGEGLDGAFAGAHVVVDLANSPSFESKAAMEFFQKSGRNLAAAEKKAGVGHHVALSVVGTERLMESGYFRAKMAQEEAIEASGVPYTIVRATQFFEFVAAIVQDAASGETIRATSALIQPMAAEDVAEAVVDAALAGPANGMVEVGGPEAMGIDEIIRTHLAAQADRRPVITDDKATYFGVTLAPRALTPGAGARIAPTRFADWLTRGGAAPGPRKG